MIIAGSIGSFIWALILPEYDGEVAPQPQMDPAEASRYGIVLGLAAAAATAFGFALDVAFVGWLVGSTVLVMRPDIHTLNLRSLGRVISVIIGGIAAALLLLADPPAGVVAVVLWLVLVLMTATSHSTYYVTPAFTSFLILWALLYGKAELDDLRDGQPIHPHSLSQTFDRIARRAPVPVIRLHDLRHTHGSILIANGVHSKVVSERLGHAWYAFTVETYQHVLPGMGEGAARVFESVLTPGCNPKVAKAG